MSITDKFIIEDKSIREAIRAVESDAKAGKDGNCVVSNKELQKADFAKMKEGVIYFDQLSNKDQTVRVLIKRKGKTYMLPFTEIDQ